MINLSKGNASEIKITQSRNQGKVHMTGYVWRGSRMKWKTVAVTAQSAAGLLAALVAIAHQVVRCTTSTWTIITKGTYLYAIIL